MTKNWDRLKYRKSWVFYMNKLFGFYNWFHNFNMFNRFNLDVINNLVQIGCRFFFEVILYLLLEIPCHLHLPSPLNKFSPHPRLSQQFEPYKWFWVFFLGGDVACLKLNLSHGVGSFVRVFSLRN